MRRPDESRRLGRPPRTAGGSEPVCFCCCTINRPFPTSLSGPASTSTPTASAAGNNPGLEGHFTLFVTTEARADKLRPDADRPLGPTPGNPFFPIEPGIGGPGGGGFVPGGPGVIPPNVQVVPGVVERAQPEPVPPPKKEERKEEKKER